MPEAELAVSRIERLQHWLAQQLPAASEPQAASSDASFRRYFRIECEGASYIVMDAPPDKEDSAPFVHVAAWLQRHSIPAPRVLEADLDAGFLLLDDMGPNTMLDALEAGQNEVVALYTVALRNLIAMQVADRQEPLPVPPYDAALLEREMDLFRDWYLLRYREVEFGPEDEVGWAALKQRLIAAIEQHHVGLVHRDYHSRNLMLRPGPDLAMLDFQDAVRGSLCYDLISLLRDCYTVLTPDRYRELRQWYWRKARAQGVLPADLQESDFCRQCDWMAVQRHLKASGIFARLALRDGKQAYLADIPRTLAYVAEVSGHYPELAWLAAALERWAESKP